MVRVDCFFDHADVVVELLGYRWHRDKAQLTRDAERTNRLTLDGRRVLQFTYSMVATDPVQVLADLTEALTQRR
jgi:very-short-patch-repair endonuclease